MMYENNYAGGGITTLPGYFLGGFLGKAAGFLKKYGPQAAGFLANPVVSAIAIPTVAAGIRALRGGQQQQPQFMPQYAPTRSMMSPYGGGFGMSPYGGGFGMGTPSPYQGFLGGMQSMYGFPGQYTPTQQPARMGQPGYAGTNYNTSSQPRGQYSGDSNASSGRFRGYADGGMVDIPFEGFIPPTEDGMPESSGAVDDRVGVMKPDASEVSADNMEIMQMLKEALMNMEESWAQEIILMAVENFGEDFVVRLAEELGASGGDLPEEVEMDRMVEMQFKQNLANGGPVKIGAAIAPNEYVLTARQVRKVGGGDAKEGAKRLKGLASMLDNMDTQKPLELSAQ